MKISTEKVDISEVIDECSTENTINSDNRKD